MAVLEGTFTGTGESGSIDLGGGFNLQLTGFGTGTVVLKRSTDGGNEYAPIGTYSADTGETGFSEGTPKYKIECTAYTSGTIKYRLSQ